MFAKIKNGACALFGLGVTAVTTAGLIVSNTGVTIEASDLTTIGDANSAYLTSAFQVVELLPYIAVLSGGFFVLNKLFSIIPKVGGSN